MKKILVFIALFWTLASAGPAMAQRPVRDDRAAYADNPRGDHGHEMNPHRERPGKYRGNGKKHGHYKAQNRHSHGRRDKQDCRRHDKRRNDRGYRADPRDRHDHQRDRREAPRRDRH